MMISSFIKKLATINVTLQDEICNCPNTFKRTNTANKLTQYANDPGVLQGKKLDDMKGDAAAGTLLHELTHSENILGTAATRPIAGLASVKPHLTLNNADTLAYFALVRYRYI
ncbi:hypothetical protein EYZ11_012267 [Aspergillus tanneri]|uniref:Uncharacterized protein n=1 Tax=Aspergillus tanneri TaxID=1220188 RepID=A0A4S3J2S3_9EURO|nr:hypothetical protein EYZ11_012267 [Aspergillus tanneri]